MPSEAIKPRLPLVDFYGSARKLIREKPPRSKELSPSLEKLLHQEIGPCLWSTDLYPSSYADNQAQIGFLADLASKNAPDLKENQQLQGFIEKAFSGINKYNQRACLSIAANAAKSGNKIMLKHSYNKIQGVNDFFLERKIFDRDFMKENGSELTEHPLNLAIKNGQTETALIIVNSILSEAIDQEIGEYETMMGIIHSVITLNLDTENGMSDINLSQFLQKLAEEYKSSPIASAILACCFSSSPKNLDPVLQEIDPEKLSHEELIQMIAMRYKSDADENISRDLRKLIDASSAIDENKFKEALISTTKSAFNKIVAEDFSSIITAA